MEQKTLQKWGKNTRSGEGREQYVARHYEYRGFIVKKAPAELDLHHQVDLIAYKPFADGKMLYIQVKGFHDDWKLAEFPKLVAKAKEDNASPVIARVNKKGRIYFWNPLK